MIPDPNVTLEQVAAHPELGGVTRERVRQIERRALQRIKLVRAYLRWRAHVLGTVEAVAQQERLPARIVADFVSLDLPAPGPEPQRQRTVPSLAAE